MSKIDEDKSIVTSHFNRDREKMWQAEKREKEKEIKKEGERKEGRERKKERKKKKRKEEWRSFNN